MLVESCIGLLESIHNKEWGANKISPNLKGDDKVFGEIIDLVFEEFTKREIRQELIKTIEGRVSTSPPGSPITPEKFSQYVQESSADIRLRSPEILRKSNPTFIETSFIESNIPGLSPEKAEALTKMIKRLFEQMHENPIPFQGEGKRINGLIKETYTDPETKEKTIIKTPKTLWMHLSDDKKHLRIQVYSKKVIGSGTYKIVKSSKTLVLDFTDEHHHDKRVVSSVYIKSKDLISEGERLHLSASVIKEYEQEDIDRLQASMKDAAKIFTQEELDNDQAIHIKALPDVTHIYTGKKGRKRLEWEEPMYFGGDLLEVVNAGRVKVDEGNVVELNTLDKLRIIKSILYTSQKMHEKGIIHRDVKSRNVFLGYDGKLQGYLGDFDLVCKVGKNILKSNYAYWDLPSCKGLVLPTSDLFGSAMVFGEAFLGADFYEISQRRFYPSRNQIPQLINERASQLSLSKLTQFKNDNSDKLSVDDKRILVTAVSRFNNNDIDGAIEIIRQQVRPEGLPEFKKLLAELELLQATGALLKEVFEADKALNQYLEDPKNSALRQTLSDGGNEESLQTIYELFPTYKNLYAKIAGIEQQWKTTVSGDEGS